MQHSFFKKEHLDQESWKRIDQMYKEGVTRQRERSKPKPCKNTFRPRISPRSRKMKRPQSITDILYGDALRKQQERQN